MEPLPEFIEPNTTESEPYQSETREAVSTLLPKAEPVQQIPQDVLVLTPQKQDSIRPSVMVGKNEELYETLEDLNDLVELRRLERRSIVVDTLRANHYLLADMDTTFARRVSGIVMRNSDPEKAWELFKSINASSTGQKAILTNLEKYDFVNIWGRCRSKLAEEDSDIFSCVYKRTHFESSAEGKKKKGQILWNDFYEINQNPRRSLEMMRQSGVVIELPDEYIDQLRAGRRAIEEKGTCPILEKIKNQKIFTISGLKGSKASLTIHDLFDHFWSYDLLEREGVFERYKDFLTRVGNPQNTDMFKRESELIASTVFGTRLYRMAEEDFVPILSFDKIKKVLEKSAATEKVTPNQQRALQILDSLDPQSVEAGSLSYDVSNMAIELMEQRRKHGFIKNLEVKPDGSLSPVGVMDILDPEYIALMVEINHMILDPTNKAEQSLLNISVMVEDYLVRVSRSPANTQAEPLTVKVEDVNAYDTKNSSLKEDRVEWLKKNSGFASTKASLC